MIAALRSVGRPVEFIRPKTMKQLKKEYVERQERQREREKAFAEKVEAVRRSRQTPDAA